MCRKKKESEKQTFSFPSANNFSQYSEYIDNRKNSYNSMYKRKPKWNLSLTYHFNRNANVGRLWIIYTHQNLDNKFAINVTKGEKKKLFDFMSTLWGVPVVKVRQKTDHKHWKTILISLSLYKLVQSPKSLTFPAWNYKPALIGE